MNVHSLNIDIVGSEQCCKMEMIKDVGVNISNAVM